MDGTVTFLLAVLLCQTVMPLPAEVMDQYGELAFTDGSSVYTFQVDGTFLLNPAGMSGRTIEGRWSALDEYRFEIEGTWGWCNGLSAENDRRRMVLYINVLSSDPEESDMLRGENTLIWDVYFTVEELLQL